LYVEIGHKEDFRIRFSIVVCSLLAYHLFGLQQVRKGGETICWHLAKNKEETEEHKKKSNFFAKFQFKSSKIFMTTTLMSERAKQPTVGIFVSTQHFDPQLFFFLENCPFVTPEHNVLGRRALFGVGFQRHGSLKFEHIGAFHIVPLFVRCCALTFPICMQIPTPVTMKSGYPGLHIKLRQTWFIWNCIAYGKKGIYKCAKFFDKMFVTGTRHDKCVVNGCQTKSQVTRRQSTGIIKTLVRGRNELLVESLKTD
jgi:hypothetical protein